MRECKIAKLSDRFLCFMALIALAGKLRIQVAGNLPNSKVCTHLLEKLITVLPSTGISSRWGLDISNELTVFSLAPRVARPPVHRGLAYRFSSSSFNISPITLTTEVHRITP